MNTLDYIINFSLPPGDPHQFEQKFNYRRPMYPILKYMWDKDNYRESIKVTEHEPQHFKSYMLVWCIFLLLLLKLVTTNNNMCKSLLYLYLYIVCVSIYAYDMMMICTCLGLI